MEIYKKDLFADREEVVEIPIYSSSDVLNGDASSLNDVSLRKIVGSDDRARIPDMLMNNTPYSCVGVVRVEYYSGKVSFGTGFLFGPNDVATAGHIFAKYVDFVFRIFKGERLCYYVSGRDSYRLCHHNDDIFGVQQ